MTTELQHTDGNQLLNNSSTPASYAQTGNKNVQVHHADKVETHQHQTVVIAGNNPKENEAFTDIANAGGMNNDYYNLFVLSDEKYDAEYFTIDRDRSLTEFITPIVKEIFYPFNSTRIKDIMRMPTLFASENHQYGSTDSDHMISYGIITQIKDTSSGYRIYFKSLMDFSQQLINELSNELDLVGNNSFNELNRTHWTIKNIDLISELRKSGLPVLSL